MKSFVMRRCARSPFSREIERKATQIRRAAVGIDDGVIRVLRIQIPACCSEHETVRRAYHGLQLDTAGARLSPAGRSERRRVGKGCVSRGRSRGWPLNKKKKQEKNKDNEQNDKKR